MTPLNLTEWAQSLAVGSGPNADFAREVLDLIRDDCAADYAELVEALENTTDRPARAKSFSHDQALKALEGLCDKVNILDEISEKLADAGYPGDPEGKKGFPSGPVEMVETILSKLEAVSNIMDWVRSPEDHAEAIADLRKLFPLPRPKLEFDL